jgi:hypothetical protein
MATTAWLGAALKVPQQDTILLTLTWAAADTIDALLPTSSRIWPT